MDFPDVINHEEDVVEINKQGNTCRDHIITFAEPIDETTFENYVESQAWFGYHPGKYGGTTHAVSGQGEKLTDYDPDKSRQTWIWSHADPLDEQGWEQTEALTKNVLEAFDWYNDKMPSLLTADKDRALDVLTALTRAHEADGGYRRHFNCTDLQQFDIDQCFQVDVHHGADFVIYRAYEGNKEKEVREVEVVESELAAIWRAIDWLVERAGIPEEEAE